MSPGSIGPYSPVEQFADTLRIRARAAKASTGIYDDNRKVEPVAAASSGLYDQGTDSYGQGQSGGHGSDYGRANLADLGQVVSAIDQTPVSARTAVSGLGGRGIDVFA